MKRKREEESDVILTGRELELILDWYEHLESDMLNQTEDDELYRKLEQAYDEL